jgi:hypothetical protein
VAVTVMTGAEMTEEEMTEAVTLVREEDPTMKSPSSLH